VRSFVPLLLFPLLAACFPRSPERLALADYKDGFGRTMCSGRFSEPTAHVASQVSADTAIVAVIQDCIANPPCPAGNVCDAAARAVRNELDYLAVRKNGRWTVKPVSGGQMIGL